MEVNPQYAASQPLGGRPRPAAALTAAKMPVSEKQRMENAGQNLGRYLSKAPSYSEIIAGHPDTQAPQALNLSDSLSFIARSSNGLTALADVTENINHFGKKSPDRRLHMAAMMMPFAMWMVRKKDHAMHKGAGPGAAPGELRMLKVFEASHGEGWTLPEWSWYAHPFVDYSCPMLSLPGPVTYLNQLAKPLPEVAQIVSAMEIAQEKLAEAKRKADNFLRGKEPNQAGAEAQDHEAESQQKKIEQCEAQLDRILYARTDIDPSRIEECCAEVQVSAQLKPEAAQALIRLEDNLAKLLKACLLVPGPNDTPPPQELVWPELIVTEEGSRVAYIKLSTASLLESGKDIAIQKELLQQFFKVRQALVNAADSYPPSKSRNDTRSAIEQKLQTLFPLDPAVERQMMAVLVQEKDPDVKAVVSQLLTSKIKTPVAGVSNAFGSTTLLEQPGNLESLGWAVSIMLTGDEQMADGIRKALQQTALQPVVDFTGSLQRALFTGDSALLANTLNDEIKRQREAAGPAAHAAAQGTQNTYAKLAALILSAKVLAEHPLYKACLKEQIRDLDGLSELARSLTNQIGPKAKASAEFVEHCRIAIEAGFSTTLDDYWGHQTLVQKLYKKLQIHLELLEKRSLWGLLPAGYVIPNGYLLYGPPGTGKTFLATCIANTLKIPLLVVSNDEMSKTLTHMRSEAEEMSSSSKTLKSMAEERLEKALTRFLDSKVAQAETMMRKNGARSIVLFFDEIEGWLLKRTLVLSAPEQVSLTDNMLRLFESYVKKHPEIIFMAATNHYELLDDAATRLGRFGHFLNIGRTSKEDAMDILEKSIKALQLTLDTKRDAEQIDQLAAEAAGMNPLAIKQAVYNRYAINLVRSADGKAELSLANLMEAIKDMREWTTPPVENGNGNGKKAA